MKTSTLRLLGAFKLRRKVLFDKARHHSLPIAIDRLAMFRTNIAKQIRKKRCKPVNPNAGIVPAFPKGRW